MSLVLSNAWAGEPQSLAQIRLSHTKICRTETGMLSYVLFDDTPLQEYYTLALQYKNSIGIIVRK